MGPLDQSRNGYKQQLMLVYLVGKEKRDRLEDFARECDAVRNIPTLVKWSSASCEVQLRRPDDG